MKKIDSKSNRKPLITIHWSDGGIIPDDKPWRAFEVELNKYFKINYDLGTTSEYFICFNLSEKVLEWIYGLKTPLKNSILIIMEPKTVCPLNYIRQNRELFMNTFIASPLWKMNEQEVIFNWPQAIDIRKTKKIICLNKSRNKDTVLINSDKISFIKGEMYSLRKKIVCSLPIVLYGKNWNKEFPYKIRRFLFAFKKVFRQSIVARRILFDLRVFVKNGIYLFRKPQDYRGAVLDKSILTLSEFSLVIENELTYVSEKLFDVISAGCIPIYIGPDLKLFGLDLPRDFICNPNVHDIRRKMKFLSEMNDCDREYVRDILLKFLQVCSHDFDSLKVMTKLAEDLVSTFERNDSSREKLSNSMTELGR